MQDILQVNMPGRSSFVQSSRFRPWIVPQDYQTVMVMLTGVNTVSRTKHVWYSEHGTYYRFEFILERAMSATHVAVILRMRTSPAYEEEFMKMDYPDARNEYGTS